MWITLQHEVLKEPHVLQTEQWHLMMRLEAMTST